MSLINKYTAIVGMGFWFFYIPIFALNDYFKGEFEGLKTLWDEYWEGLIEYYHSDEKLIGEQ